MVIIILSHFLITHEKITSLEYELLGNNVSYTLAKSTSDYKTISAIGMADLVFYKEATKKGVYQNIKKNLTPDTSIAIIDTISNEIVFSVGENSADWLSDIHIIQSMASQKSGLAEYDLKSKSGETVNTMAAFDEYPNWNSDYC